MGEWSVNNAGTEALIKRVNRRHLWLFSDVLLVAEPGAAIGKKPTGKEKIVVKQVIETMRKAA